MGCGAARARGQLGDALVTELSPARRVALDILLDLEESGAYARDGLDASPELRELSRRDAGLATRLVLGVVATYGCLDELIDTYCEKPGRMNARIREALRIAAFEIVYLGTEPRAAVSQGVELVRTRAKSAAGFANAVLRRIVADRGVYLAAEDVPAGSERDTISAARSAGLPAWLAGEVIASLGFERARLLFDCELEPAPVAVHLNPHDVTAEDVLAGLRVGVSDVAELPGCIAPVASSELMHTDLLKRSAVAVCDLNAQVVATAATAPGDCLEVGAGRGTKSFVMAAQATRCGMRRSAVAVELSKKKNRLNRRRLERAGLIDCVCFFTGDGCDLDRTLSETDRRAGERRLFDSVLVDAPCTGTGTMRRHPEIPWRLLPEDIDRDMPGLQLALLTEAARRVRPGGQLIYATCSVLQQENAAVVDAFLNSKVGRGFALAPVSQAPIFERPEFADAAAYVRSRETNRGLFQTVPALDSFDGHFCARLVRRKTV